MSHTSGPGTLLDEAQREREYGFGGGRCVGHAGGRVTDGEQASTAGRFRGNVGREEDRLAHSVTADELLRPQEGRVVLHGGKECFRRERLPTGGDSTNP
jgi:hypothetical protein